ncbi:NifU family protein, partial [candidate division KSB1 bacterium]
MREQVEKVLEEIRGWLKADGGDVELIDVSEDGVVTLRLKGACHGCPMAEMTLHSGIRRVL